jgi:hypothetical protein
MLERAPDPVAVLREELLDAQHELVTKKPFAVFW